MPLPVPKYTMPSRSSVQPELMDLPVWQLRAMVRNGSVTPSDLVEASLARIDERDGDLNAFLFVDRSGARAIAAGAVSKLPLTCPVRVSASAAF